MARDNGGVRVPVPLTGDYRFDLAAMREAVNERTKLVIVVNPNNPNGTIRSGKELAAFIRSLPPPSSQPSTRPTRST
jgi:histidinol-phosphate aminotransferase